MADPSTKNEPTQTSKSTTRPSLETDREGWPPLEGPWLPLRASGSPCGPGRRGQRRWRGPWRLKPVSQSPFIRSSGYGQKNCIWHVCGNQSCSSTDQVRDSGRRGDPQV